MYSFIHFCFTNKARTQSSNEIPHKESYDFQSNLYSAPREKLTPHKELYHIALRKTFLEGAHPVSSSAWWNGRHGLVSGLAALQMRSKNSAYVTASPARDNQIRIRLAAGSTPLGRRWRRREICGNSMLTVSFRIWLGWGAYDGPAWTGPLRRSGSKEGRHR